ncbi:MAG: hypothetical protein ACTSVU_06285 [Promethearchaeota archaeon]
MEDTKIIKEKGVVIIEFPCPICKNFHKITISTDQFDKISVPGSILFFHHKPDVILKLGFNSRENIDSIEELVGIQIDNKQLESVLAKGAESVMKKIPIKSIYAFKLMKNDEIIKIYCRKDYQDLLIIQKFGKIWKISSQMVENEEVCNEYYMKYTNFWIGAVNILDYHFYMVVSAKIDIDHFKAQLMSTFEIFSKLQC